MPAGEAATSSKQAPGSDGANKTREIVQYQGWLTKRGESYEEEDFVTFPFLAQASSQTAPASNTPANRANYAADASVNADAVFNAILATLRGKSEKKRFFRLVTLEHESNPSLSNLLSGASSSNLLEYTPRLLLTRNSVREAGSTMAAEPRVELRYYQDERCQHLRGVIPITADCDLLTSSEDANLVLQCPGKRYFFRPCDGSTSILAKTTSQQWADAIRREIRLLFQLRQLKRQYARNGQSTLSPSLSLLGLTGAGRYARAESALFAVEDPEPIPQSLSEILAQEKSRNEFHDFLVSALAVENLLFYTAVEKHCETQEEMQEIIRLYVRPGSEHEVNLAGHQRAALLALKPPYKKSDFEPAKQEIFRLMETNFFKRFHREAMDRTGAFAALYATLGIDGFRVVLAHFGPIKTDLDRLTAAMRAKLKCAEDVISRITKELATSSREVAVREQSTNRRALVAIYHATMVRMDALTDFVEEMDMQVVRVLEELTKKMDQDLKTIHSSVEREIADLENCKRALSAAQQPGEVIELENELEQMESAYTKPMESAMAKLESLELYRIETLREVMLHSVMAEKNLSADSAKATELLATASEMVEIDKDIQEFTRITARDLMLMQQ